MESDGRQQEVTQESHREAMLRVRKHIDKMFEMAIDAGWIIEGIHFTRGGDLKDISFYVK